MTLTTVQRPAFTVVGMQTRTAPMSPDIPALWPKFVARIDEIAHPAEPFVSYGVMEYHDGRLDYLATVSVAAAAAEPPPGMVRLAIPAGTYAVFRYPLSQIAAGFGEIHEKLLPSSPYRQAPGPFYERYDETFDPANPQSTVEIRIPIIPR